jgi:hypothetical protein
MIAGRQAPRLPVPPNQSLQQTAAAMLVRRGLKLVEAAAAAELYRSAAEGFGMADSFHDETFGRLEWDPDTGRHQG